MTDFKLASADLSLPSAAILFGADAGDPAAAADPSVYPVARLQRALIGKGHLSVINPRPGQTAFDSFGTNGNGNPGTATARTPDDASLYTSLPCVGFASAASAGSSAQLRTNSGAAPIMRGANANRHGFRTIGRFGVGDAAAVANARMFVGYNTSTAAMSNAEPSSLTNIIGVGCDAGETTLSIMHNDGSGTATKVALGADFPTDTLRTDLYELLLEAQPGASTVEYRVNRYTTDPMTPAFTASGSISSDLPATGTGLQFHFWRNNGATALAVIIDFFGFQQEVGRGAF